MTTAVQVGLVVAIAVVLGAAIAVRVLRRQFDIFEPITLFVLAYGVMFVARPAAMLIGHHLAYDGPNGSTDVSHTFLKMLVLALLGAVGFVAAYETGVGRRLASRWRGLGDLATKRMMIAAVAIGAAGVASFVTFLISSSGSSGLSLIFRGRTAEFWREVRGTTFYVYDAVFLLVPATLVLFALGLERRRKPLLIAAVAFGGIYLLWTVPLGDRIALLPFLGGGFVFWYLKRGARPSAVTLVSLAIVALFASAFLSDLRGRSTRHENVAQTIIRAIDPSRVAAPLYSGPDSEMAPAFAAALTQIPSKLHYTYGLTILGNLVSRPIPRALWSSKPELPRDRLDAALWPVATRRGGINPEFSVLLYLFWDFGFTGVIVGMSVFGIGARCLYEYLRVHADSLAVQVVYALALWFVVIGLRNDPVDTFIQFAFVVLPVWLVVRMPSLRGARLAAAVTR